MMQRKYPGQDDRKGNHALCFSFLLLLLTFPLAAHDDLPGQIHDVTQKIAEQPRNAALWLQRAELHRLDEDPTKAERDYRRALELDPSLDAAYLGRGMMLFESGHPLAAVAPLRHYLGKQPDDSRARAVLARTLVQLNRMRDAVGEFDAALAEADDPDLLVERARALTADGRTREALHTLDEAMTHLGPIASLQLVAIELELELCDREAALARIDASAAAAPRKEVWLARRGDILRELDRRDEARDAYEQALQALTTLPVARRQTRAVRDLETRLREATGQ